MAPSLEIFKANFVCIQSHKAPVPVEPITHIRHEPAALAVLVGEEGLGWSLHLPAPPLLLSQ